MEMKIKTVSLWKKLVNIKEDVALKSLVYNIMGEG